MCTRRPRAQERRLYMGHVVAGRGRISDMVEFETDREHFIGRGRTIEAPSALVTTAPLSGATGAVLDPIASLRVRVKVPPGVTARLSFATVVAEHEDGVRALIEKYHDPQVSARAFALASTHSEIELRHLGVSRDDEARFQRLAARVIYADPRLRSAEAVLRNTGTPPDLWQYGISGDLPIVLVTVADAAEVGLARELLRAQEYLRARGFVFDLVILNELPTSYRDDVQDELQRMAESGPSHVWMDKPGGLFLRRGDAMAEARSRAASRCRACHLRRLARRARSAAEAPAPSAGAAASSRDVDKKTLGPWHRTGRRASEHSRIFQRLRRVYAGWSRISRRGASAGPLVERRRQRTVRVRRDRIQPRKYVVAKQLSESADALEQRSNRRPARQRLSICVTMPAGSSGAPLHRRRAEAIAYNARFGQGYVIYEHRHGKLAVELTVFVPVNDAVKVLHLRVRNDGPASRELSLCYYVDWCLSDNRSRSAAHIVTSIDQGCGALFARNAFRAGFGSANCVPRHFDVEPDDDRRPNELHRAQRHVARSCGDAVCASGRPSGRGARPMRGCPGDSDGRRRRDRRRDLRPG